MPESFDEKMSELYEVFLDDLLEVVKSGKVKASDRAVIRQFLKDHGMANKVPNHPGVQDLANHFPNFEDEDDSLNCM
jgi:hypothetical protein